VKLRNFALTCVLPAALAMAACATSKSADPLSPTVAGPIPGVNITSPSIMQPSLGAKVSVEQQPLTLTVGNAASSGVRPLTYVFEIAADASFANKVFSRDGIAPGSSQTSLRLPDALATGRTYFWHARAEDGANTGPFSSTAAFDVFTPIVIGAPVLTAPINNVIVDSPHPTFSFNNAPHSGPVGPLSYVIEVADGDGFGNKLAVWVVAEQPGQTHLDSPQDLPPIKQLFWHVRAADQTTAGPWSPTQVFQTPAPIVLPPPLPPPDVPSGPSPGDALNLSSAAVYNSPADIASWPATARITRVDMSPGSGLNLEFTTKGSWPDYTPAGWDGPLQYTVWAVVNINGRWNTSGFIQMWRGRPSTGAPILSEFARNWAYDGRWGPMMGYQPRAGEQMGFFVSAGNARGESGVTSRRERSNVVLIPLPGGDSGSFPFSSLPPVLSLKLR
jgi:hypothetical protein